MTTGEIAVIGAGPAGTSAAIALSELGHPVAIYERTAFPRPRIGESLPPKIGQIFRLLGVDEAIARASFVRMSGTTVQLGGEPKTHVFDASGRALGFQVERARFDQILLDRARAMGARIVEGAHVTGVLRGGDGSVLGIRLREGGEVAAPFVVDASGSSSVLARSLGLKRRESIHTVALSQYFEDSARPASGTAEDTLFEMLEDGWVWSVLLSDGTRNVTVGLDASELKAGHGDSAAIHRAYLARSKLVGPLVERARPVSSIAAHDATWFYSERYTGPGFLLSGDAASFIDPLTSQGVYKAMCSGINAAAVINTILRRPASAEIARAFYEERELGAYTSYTEAALALYRTSPYLDLPFWRVRLRGADAVESAWLARFEGARERREAFTRLVENRGGDALRVRAKASLAIEERPAIRGGYVVLVPALASHSPGELEAPGGIEARERIDVEKLLPLLDGRTLADVFEGYIAATGIARSTAGARSLLDVIGMLHETDAVEVF